MNRDSKRPRLGRGLSSLIRDSSQQDPPGQYQPVPEPIHAAQVLSARQAVEPPAGIRTLMVPLQSIEPNPYQPRRSFDARSLQDLAASIRAHGLLQPVLVAEIPSADGARRYRLIAGERRLRAAQQAGATSLPCVLRPAEGANALELALVENIHREDLNPIERASAYRDLMDRFNLTQEQVSEQVAQPRPTVANYLRLLDLCDDVQKLILEGKVSFGHAKVLAGLAGDLARQTALARKVAEAGLSVRQLEEMVAAIHEGAEPVVDNKGQTHVPRSPYLADLERQLSERIGTKVVIRPGRAKHSGRIVIEYYSLEDFDRIVGALGAAIES